MPSLISGDDRAILTGTYSAAKIETDVFASGVWQKRSEDDLTQVYKIDGAHVFQDRFQAGFSLPIQTRSLSGAQSGVSSGLGDVTGLIGYEILPDWDYNPWRPHGVGFFSVTLPTGKSIYESDNGTGLDSRGRGFWSFGLGALLNKSWSIWDANSSFEFHRSLAKDVDNAQIKGRIKPGFGGAWSVGAGYNIRNLRLGSSLQWNYEDAIQVEGNNSSEGSLQRFATGSLSASYLFEEKWSGTLTYADQTLFGNPTNTTLSRSAAIFLQRRWSR